MMYKLYWCDASSINSNDMISRILWWWYHTICYQFYDHDIIQYATYACTGSRFYDHVVWLHIMMAYMLCYLWIHNNHSIIGFIISFHKIWYFFMSSYMMCYIVYPIYIFTSITHKFFLPPNFGCHFCHQLSHGFHVALSSMIITMSNACQLRGKTSRLNSRT